MKATNAKETKMKLTATDLAGLTLSTAAAAIPTAAIITTTGLVVFGVAIGLVCWVGFTVAVAIALHSRT